MHNIIALTSAVLLCLSVHADAEVLPSDGTHNININFVYESVLPIMYLKYHYRSHKWLYYIQ